MVHWCTKPSICRETNFFTLAPPMEVSRVRAAALRAFLAALHLEKHAATLVALDLGNVDEYCTPASAMSRSTAASERSQRTVCPMVMP